MRREQFFVLIRVAANLQGKYDLDFKNPLSDLSNSLTVDELAEMYKRFTENFPVISIEDPFEQDAWDAFSQITYALPNIQWVGDDLLVTNIQRVKTGIEKKACNTLLLKVRKTGLE